MLSNEIETYLGFAKGAFNSWKETKNPRAKYGSIEEYYAHQIKCVESAKKWVKDAIQVWLKENNISGFITIDGMSGFYGEDRISLDAVTIHNGFGSVVKKNNWMNKINIMKNGSGKFFVKTHKVTTDIAYLHPTQEKFRDFIEELYNYLQS